MSLKDKPDSKESSAQDQSGGQPGRRLIIDAKRSILVPNTNQDTHPDTISSDDQSSTPISSSSQPSSSTTPAKTSRHVADWVSSADNTQPSQQQPHEHNSASTNISPSGLGRFRQHPIAFLLRLSSESAAFFNGEDWRAYQNYIGSPIMYPEYTNEIRKALLGSKRVREAIDKVVESKSVGSNDSKIRRKLWKDCTKTVEDMIAEMDNLRFLRLFALVINNVLVRMYHQGIHIQESEFLQVRKAAEYAYKNKISLIFLPCHKSHIDYLVISAVFYRLGLSLPHIAAGENLNMPVVGKILKKGGAFFIKRQWGHDPMYLAIMKEYLEILLERGHNIEAFIEGTRSRTGKLLQPKFGILKMIMESILKGDRVKDCIIIPMSIGYDKVIESAGYVNELLGTPKEKESLTQLLSNVNILSFKWGRIDVRFAQPFSLKNYIASQKEARGTQFNPSSSLQDRSLLLQSLGFRVLSDINEVSIVMPTALVGTILLTLRGRGLIRKVKWLKKEIVKKKGRVADFGGMTTAEIVDKAISVLRDLISVRQELLEPVFYPNKRFDLSLYRNQVIHLFISEAVVSAALYATIKAGGPMRSQRVPLRPHLEEDIFFLSTLLKYEFIFSTGGLRSNIEMTLDELVKSDVFTLEEEPLEPGQGAVLTDQTKWVGLSKEERRIGREHFDFYCFLLWPFIETYWLTSVCLFSLLQDHPTNRTHVEPSAWVDERVFLNRCQFFGKTLYYEGDLSYFESVNIETIKNALRRLRDNHMLITYSSAYPPRIPLSSFKKQADGSLVFNPNAATVKPITTHPSQGTGGGSNKVWIALHPDWIPPPLPSISAHTLKSPSSSKHKKPVVNEEDDALAEWYLINPQGRLWDFCERIGRYRREGKNRRDTATVATRVLRLARISCHWVFDAAGKKKPHPAMESKL